MLWLLERQGDVQFMCKCIVVMQVEDWMVTIHKIVSWEMKNDQQIVIDELQMWQRTLTTRREANQF